jgi:hypothetical protein
MNRFENFATFSYTKLELKGGLFYEIEVSGISLTQAQ